VLSRIKAILQKRNDQLSGAGNERREEWEQTLLGEAGGGGKRGIGLRGGGRRRGRTAD